MQRGTLKGPGAERKQKFQESLVNNLKDSDDDRDQYLGKLLGVAFRSAVAHDGRSSTPRARLRIQASNFGSVQVLLAATQGDCSASTIMAEY